jgi:hypothetical protein
VNRPKLPKADNDTTDIVAAAPAVDAEPPLAVAVDDLQISVCSYVELLNDT